MGEVLTILALVDWATIEREELEAYKEGKITTQQYENFRDERDFVTKFIRTGDYWATDKDYERLAHIVSTRVLI